jgi:D-alanine-D-alanine ligase
MKNIGVFFGGKSPEHDVSIITGQVIISGLKKTGFNPIPIYINKEGIWFIGKELDNIKIFTSDSFEKYKKLSNYYIDLTSKGKLTFIHKGLLKTKIVVDVAFPALHGMNGEDGTIQGLFEILNVPYVGCNVESSATSMDKVTTKLIYRANNIPTTDFVFYNHFEWQKNKQKCIDEIKKIVGFPLFVKPSKLGSSIGISKVKNLKELNFAIEVAFHYDNKIVVEKAVNNLKDITCCLLGNNNPKPSLLQESSFEKDFFSYDDKYLKGGGSQLGKNKKNIIIPAEIDPKITREIQNLAKKVFILFGCSGIARVDFLYDNKTNRYFVNEINTLPGTLYHHLWKESGIKFEELLKELIRLAEEKFSQKKEYIYTFESDILKSSSSSKLKLNLDN